MVARASWLGWRARADSPEARENDEHRKQLAWLVTHRPTSNLTRTVATSVAGWDRGPLREELRALWLAAVERVPNDPGALVNASNFFAGLEPERSLMLLQSARDLSPTDPGLELKLSHHWLLRARRQRLAEPAARYYLEDRYDAEPGRKALAHAERAVALSGGSALTDTLLVNRVESAVAAGRWDLSEQYATELSAWVDHAPVRARMGDAVFHSQRILGHVALRRGDVEAAKAHLLRCCSGGSSPVLHSFGPDFSLAQELLDRGERETVLEFLEQCRTIWTDHSSTVDRLVQEVRSGGNCRLSRR
jgi:hypothetical protein